MTTGVLADSIRSALERCALIPTVDGITVTDEDARLTLSKGAVTGSEDDFWAFYKKDDGSKIEMRCTLRDDIIYVHRAKHFTSDHTPRSQ